MRIDLIYTALPPIPNAIGDHTSLLAEAMAAHASVKVLTAAETHDPIPGVAVERAFSMESRKGVLELRASVAKDPPDWLVLQFNPFSYGHWGFNPYLARVVRQIRRDHPKMGFAMMVHETAAPWLNWRLALMSTWQLGHLWRLGRKSDVIFLAIDPWMPHFRRWLPGRALVHLPVGANIPYLGATRSDARERLGIDEEAVVLGVFGTAHPTRLLPFVRQAAHAVRAKTEAMLVLYVGPDGPMVQAAMGDLPFRDAGRLPAEEVSWHFAAMDVYLAPFRQGVSARRGSFQAAIQHGVPTVSTVGRHTDTFLREAHGEALLLADDRDANGFTTHTLSLVGDAAFRERIGKAARTLYLAHCDWPVLADKLIASLKTAT